MRGLGEFPALFFFPEALINAPAVPEPSTWLLLGSGLVALVFARRKLAA